jgi:spore coat protein CotH
MKIGIRLDGCHHYREYVMRVSILALSLVVLCSGVTPLRAQTADDLFDPGGVHDIRLFVNSRDLQLLRGHWNQNTYYPADLQWGSIRMRNVGIRSRGRTTRNPIKLGLEIDFTRYNPRQQFLGLRSLVLDNHWRDPAMIREQVAMAFFQRMGEPAPRESFCRLYINNQYQGLYSIVEMIDEGFLNRTLGEYSSYLFEYHYARPFHAGYPGDTLAAYRPMFEPRTHQQLSEGLLFSPIRDLFREINEPVDSGWRDRVGQYIDLEQFVRTVAIEMFLSESDGVTGFAGMNNFYFHRQAGGDRHRFIVWDKDLTFSNVGSSVLRLPTANELLWRVLAFPDFQALYLATLEACANAAAADGWLLGEVERSASLVAKAASEDRLKPFSNDEFNGAVEYLKAFASARPAFVRQSVDDARRLGILVAPE